ncbi:MAG TPA: SDR family NAD(P)-dependent oxidoreductase [Myxococcaceae bacterium]|nr:SDR family NAD(P)-dependent oxidoreductase [Myxococcaceae bacterium]
MNARLEPAAARTLARLSSLEPEAARRELMEQVLEIVNELLERDASDPVGPRTPLMEAGFNSLRAVDLSVVLQKRFLCELRPTVAFDHPTPEALAAHLAERVLDLPPPQVERPAEPEEGLAGELERVSKLSDEESRILLARSVHKLRRLERERTQPIAIVGMACRFPGGVESPEALWRQLEEGRSSVSEIEESRWPMSRFYHPDRGVPGRINSRYAGMLANIADFDARFFNMSPREAAELDPQQRLLLEVSWEAMERANIPASDLYGAPVGVFIGVRASEYFESQSGGTPEESTAYRATGNALSTAAGRISYTFGFKGPCMPVDTACSSSLVAIHLAVTSLRRGECTAALAGGANVLIDPLLSVALARANMLAADGRCKSFDASGDGYVRAEALGMLVLKPLHQALRDGDRVHAVIRGTAVNQDGASGGLTVPSGPAQEAVIREALADAGVQPWRVGFVEAHGTGTVIGDPIEIAALDRVFGGAARFHGQPLIVGAGKTNHGHAECAAGVAGVIKTALALEHERIPKNLHFNTPNPRVPWDHSVVQVASEPVDWRRGATPRFAGVSSYGFSGTNAHAILEEAPLRARPKRRVPREGGELFCLSARAEADLARLADRYAGHLEGGSFELDEVAFTAARGRSHHPFRAAVTAGDVPALVGRLRALAEGHPTPGTVQGIASGAAPSVAFLFTGQGSQRAGMGRDLYRTEPAFRAELDLCAAVLDPLLGVPLTSVLWGDHADRLDDTRYTQPAMVAYQLALAGLWRSWGVQPRWVLGHSIGEIAAACVAGDLTAEQALRIAEVRGRLMDGLEVRGAMASVAAPAEEVEALLGPGRGVNVAAYNGPTSVVISGRTTEVAAIGEAMRAKGVRVTPLTVSHAFHSSLMEPMLDAFRAAVSEMKGGRRTREWISTLAPGAAPSLEGDYWVRHVREPVRFAEGMRRLAAEGCKAFVEVGPSGTLLAMGRACVEAKGAQWIASQHPEGHGRDRALAALGQLYVAGIDPRWEGVFDAGVGLQKVDLPTYPFNRRRHWLQRPAGPVARGAYGEETHPLLGARLPLPPLSGGETIYSTHLSERWPAYLVDHRLSETSVFPGAGYVEMALALAATLPGARAVTGLRIAAAMALDERGQQVTIVLREGGEGPGGEVKSCGADGAWRSHARWSFGDAGAEPGRIDREALATRCPEEVSIPELYELLGEAGLRYGEAFRVLHRIQAGERELLAQISLGQQHVDPRYHVHPAMLDGAFQAFAVLLLHRSDVLLPAGVGRVLLHHPVSGTEVWCRATLVSEGKDFAALDVQLFDAEGRVAVELEGVRLEAAASRGAGARHGLLHSIEWVEIGEPRPSQEDAGAGRSRWLIFADRTRVAEELVWLLDERGDPVTSLSSDQVDARSAAALDEVFSELEAPCTDVVYLWPLDRRAGGADPGDPRAHEPVLGSLLRIVQAAGRASAFPARLTIVTRGAQQVGGGTDPVDLVAAPLWGFAAALAQELPAVQCRLIDLPPSGEGYAADAALLFRELRNPDGERRVAWRGGRRLGARLVAGLGARAGLEPPPGEGFELRTSGYGAFGNLGLRPLAPRPPGKGEVQIEVVAAALNFKDVLHAMGVLKEHSALRGIHRAEDQPLGIECAGRIAAVGEGVEGFRAGDAVMAMTDGSLASHVTVDANHVGRWPEGWQAAEAAGMQTVYLTAAHGLLVLAQVKPEDRVLVHAAAGGVGQAAVQICQWLGAEVFATASPGKWEHLRRQGVQHVMHSRTLDYADQVLQATSGRGVDVVLNSLGDEHIPKSLSALARGGRFVEIGKVGIWSAARMAQTRPDVAYHPFDLADVLGAKPRGYAELVERLAPGFSSGRLRPIATKTYPLAGGVAAFQALASGKTIGKIAVEMPSAEQRQARARVRGDRSYVISGGLGALGLKTAAWLAQQGAGAVVLLGRSEPGAAAAAELEALRAAGTRVHVLRVDASDGAVLEKALDGLGGQVPPVGGIVHAAGVLSDGLAAGTDWDHAWLVLAPKVAGGWNLHRWSAKQPQLGWFASYASIASVLGSAGQTSYAAANAFLEALAHERQRLGLPAVSVHWGAWAGGGMASGQSRVMRDRMRRIGMKELSPSLGLEALGAVLDAGVPQAVVASVSWPAYAQAAPAEAATFLSAVAGNAGGGGQVAGNLRSALLAAGPAERAALLLGFTRRHLAAVVGSDTPDELSADTSFAALGVDSLLGLDLRTVLERSLEITLPSSLILDHPTLGALVSYLESRLPGAPGGQEAKA